MSQVKDIIDGIKHRLPDRVNVYPDLNRAVRMISKRLFYHKSTLIQGVLSVTVPASTAYGSLPSDFWGLMGLPYVSGTPNRSLKPIPDQATKISLLTGNPDYFEIKGITTIYVYPTPTSEIVLAGDYWQRPTALTAPTNTMPYNELFDDAIQEAMIQIHVNGMGSQDLQIFLTRAVDDVAPYMEMTAPKRFTNHLALDHWSNEDVYGY